MTGAIQRAVDITNFLPDAFMLQQFSNPANPQAASGNHRH
jgi:cysteine synthase A